MEIAIESLLEGAARAAGTVVVIDVFRAFTCAAVALANGASRITLAGSVEEALWLREHGAGEVCMGEVDGRMPPGFDFGNSPFALAAVDFCGKALIQRSSAGIQGVLAARQARRLYGAALVTATATARALRAEAPARVSLVAMGHNGVRRTDEDELCALHLRHLLEGRTGDKEALRRLILAGGEVEHFRDPGFHPGDLDLALDIDRYDFAVAIETEGGRPVARRRDAGRS
jgi:2-phosphosulfolactate phosphatase